MDSLEKVMAGRRLCLLKVEGIGLADRVEAEGWLISVGGTPRENHGPQPRVTYRACRRRPNGQEAGGSDHWAWALSPRWWARRVRWAARAAADHHRQQLQRSGRCGRPQTRCCACAARPPTAASNGGVQAHVGGATGAIGAASPAAGARRRGGDAGLPETAKLLALKESILRETPDARWCCRPRPTPTCRMDMVVTATWVPARSARHHEGQAGCVITDVARPLDLPPSEVAKRPDVLVIESGEIRLLATCG